MPYAAPRHKPNRPYILKQEDRERYDSKRGTSAERGYDGAWRRSREHFLTQHPLCVDCLKEGQYVAATDVHHVLKAEDNPNSFYDSDFWMPLCHSCHSTRTARGE